MKFDIVVYFLNCCHSDHDFCSVYIMILLTSLVGRYKEAEQDLLTALDIIPDFEDAKLNLRQVQKDLAAGHRFNV